MSNILNKENKNYLSINFLTNLNIVKEYMHPIANLALPKPTPGISRHKCSL